MKLILRIHSELILRICYIYLSAGKIAHSNGIIKYNLIMGLFIKVWGGLKNK